MLANNANPAQISRFFGKLEGAPSWSWSDLLQQLRTGSMAGGLNTEGKVALTPLIQAAMRGPTGALHLALQGRADEIPAGFMGGLSGLGAGAEEALQTLRYGTNYRTALTGQRRRWLRVQPWHRRHGHKRIPAGARHGTHWAGAHTRCRRRHQCGHRPRSEYSTGCYASRSARGRSAVGIRSGEYGSTGAAIARGIGLVRQANPALDVLGQIAMPFYRTAYNVFTQGVEHSPSDSPAASTTRWTANPSTRESWSTTCLASASRGSPSARRLRATSPATTTTRRTETEHARSRHRLGAAAHDRRRQRASGAGSRAVRVGSRQQG